MEPERYFEQIRQGLTEIFGEPRRTQAGLCYGNVALEYECVGSIMIIFLSTLNWMHNVVWDGAVHLDMTSVSGETAIREVAKMMNIGKARVTRLC